MNLLGIVIITLVAILLAHVTLGNLLASTAQQSHQSTDETSTNLLDYVRSGLAKIDESKRHRHVTNPKPGNFYTQEHNSDLHSEVTDLSKFFEVEQSVPDTKAFLREIAAQNGCTGGTTDALGQCLPATPSLTDAQSGNPMRFAFGSDGTATLMPDQWSYSNENVMNGGTVDDVRGYDAQLSDYTVYAGADLTKPDGLWTSSYPYTQNFAKY